MTCYPKSKLERPGGGQCTSGSIGQPFPPPSPQPAPAPPSPGPPVPPAPPVRGPVQLVHGASGLCLESRQPSGNIEAAVCDRDPASALLQRFQFRADGTVTDGRGHCLVLE